MNSKESAWKKFFGSRLFIAVALVIALMIGFGYARSYYQDYEVRAQIDDLREQAQSLEGRRLELLETLQYVKSPDFVEEKARTEFNMVKPGEQMAIISSTAPRAQDRHVDNNVVALTKIPNYLKWWQYFMNGPKDGGSSSQN